MKCLSALRHVQCVRFMQVAAQVSKRISPVQNAQAAYQSLPPGTQSAMQNAREKADLGEEDLTLISQCNIRNSTVLRGAVLQYFKTFEQYGAVKKVAARLLMEPNGDFRGDLTLAETKLYLESLVELRQFADAVQAVEKMIRQSALRSPWQAHKLVCVLFTRLWAHIPPQEVLAYLASMLRALHGTCSFGPPWVNTDIVKLFFHFFRAFPEIESYQHQALSLIESQLDACAAAEFSSTLLQIHLVHRRFQLCEQVWKYKVQKKFPTTSADLTAIMEAYSHKGDWQGVVDLYESHSSVRNLSNHFELKLYAHARLHDWRNLKDSFNCLFGLGKLPSLEHYSVVMLALAHNGNTDLVEQLYLQLLRRGLTPTNAILRSMVLAGYKAGDLSRAVNNFELFKHNGIKPTSGDYLLLLRVYRRLGDLELSFKALRRLTQESYTLYDKHFACIIDTCAKTCSHGVASELFKLMEEHYGVTATGHSVSSLMRVYLSSMLPQKAVNLFKIYSNKPLDSKFLLYPVLLEAYLQLRNYKRFEETLKEFTSIEQSSYLNVCEVTIRYLAEHKHDTKAAEAVLDQFIKKNPSSIRANLFEPILKEYDRTQDTDASLALFKNMAELKVAMSTKTLLYLLKSTFKRSLKTHQDLNDYVEWSINILKRVRDKNIIMENSFLYPAVVAYPVKMLAKHHHPNTAVRLLTEYYEIFGKKIPRSDESIVVTKALMVVAGEAQNWQEFEEHYSNLMEKISKMKGPENKVQDNKRISNVLFGVLGYKMESMQATGKIQEIPSVLQEYEQMGLILTNSMWNKIIKTLVSDDKTIKLGIGFANENFIQGYSLRNANKLIQTSDEQFLSPFQKHIKERQKVNPKAFKPKKYLNYSTYCEIAKSLDEYLNRRCDQLDEEVAQLTNTYPRFMKRYLRRSRNVRNWRDFERRHNNFFEHLHMQNELLLQAL
ncbi:ABR225Cp [Eremothecium gossypii ATCC 10895]|uniref:ABR225Cp n=1 Tax=Eremothecium gossypii (strain ATCC 10895 / CBS 109.51 / FGSC 9923 / NRRL Y-1056) TaxID=284811 RepID=Q75CZ7_EREGS|nr:ABR225Cp [Eremothecium gossypii ATCC 10895]AAS50998.1 ABR225Cp [Eremothecium gossypii ATCC 10895]AEY95287.1 FABR225Cp [Eremothecium gossypii FDAG1]